MKIRDIRSWMLAAVCAGFFLGVGYWRHCRSQVQRAQVQREAGAPIVTDHDDASYFPPGPEFKLSPEAAAQAEHEEQHRREAVARRAGGAPK